MTISKNVAKWGEFCQILIILVFYASLTAGPEDELKQLLDQIDSSLVTQAQSDFAEWHQYVTHDILEVLRSPRRESLSQSHPFRKTKRCIGNI